ncbi:uncharacterized protein LOC115224037, partial [Argonauta hians]
NIMNVSSSLALILLLVAMTKAVNGFEMLDRVIKEGNAAAKLKMGGRHVTSPIYHSSETVVDITDLTWNTFDKYNQNSKIAAAGLLVVLKKNKRASTILSELRQNALLDSNNEAPIKSEDKFIPNKGSWFDFLKGKKKDEDNLGDIRKWFVDLVNKNPYMKRFQPDFVDTISRLALNRMKKLKDNCDDDDDDNNHYNSNDNEEQLVDLAIVDFPKGNGGSIHLRNYKLKVWIDCRDSDTYGGLNFRQFQYSFTPRFSVISHLADATKTKAVYMLKDFLTEQIGPQSEDTVQESDTTKATTTPTTTTEKKNC